jgi:hypothetical protein
MTQSGELHNLEVNSLLEGTENKLSTKLLVWAPLLYYKGYPKSNAPHSLLIKNLFIYIYILIFYVLSILFYGFAPAWNEGIHAQPVPFLALLMPPSSDGTDHIIIQLKFPSVASIFQGSRELKILRC